MSEMITVYTLTCSSEGGSSMTATCKEDILSEMDNYLHVLPNEGAEFDHEQQSIAEFLETAQVGDFIVGEIFSVRVHEMTQAEYDAMPE